MLKTPPPQCEGGKRKGLRKAKMRKLSIILLAAVFCIGLSGIAVAGDSAQQTVTYEVEAINELAFSANPSPLIIDSTYDGTAWAPIEHAEGSAAYDITTNCGTDAKKITAQLNENTTGTMELKIYLMAPSGAETSGTTTLTTTPSDVLINIDAVAEENIEIHYWFYATLNDHVVASTTRTVTLTLTDS